MLSLEISGGFVYKSEKIESQTGPMGEWSNLNEFLGLYFVHSEILKTG